MCGICGVKGVSVDSIQRERGQMIASLVHRGPDEQAQYCDNGEKLFLGVTRLSIVDLSETGAQPILNEDKSIILVCNGEIYNAPSLREHLLQKGHKFYSKTDLEVIVHMYEDCGEACFSKLKGMFALALWDKHKGALIIARDRFGMKPLYYYIDKEALVFASELKALFKLPIVNREMDLGALDMYFSLEYVPAPWSIYKGVRKLMPGSYMVFKDAQYRTSSFWELPGRDTVVEDITFQEAAQRLEYLLGQAVREHLLSDVPIGFFLSGGIDSSSLVALARRHLSAPCNTFSIGFWEKTFDETPHAKKVAGYFSTRHNHHMVSLQDFLDIFPTVTRCLDEPLGDFSVFPTYLISKFSRQYVKVALSGEGADELFMGYPTYLAHKYLRDHRRSAAFINSLGPAFLNFFPVSFEYFSLDFKVKQFLRGASLQDPILRHLLWMGAFSEQEKTAFYSLALRKEITSSTRDYCQNLAKGINEKGLMKRIQTLDLKTYLADDLLVKADRASMAVSLEVRAPYLDHELMEFVYGLPEEFVFQKRLFKYVMKKYLPPDILSRGKQGFSIPFSKWLKEDKTLILFNDYFDKSFIKKQGLFDHVFIDQMLAEHRSQRADHRKKLGTYIMFQAWYQNSYLLRDLGKME